MERYAEIDRDRLTKIHDQITKAGPDQIEGRFQELEEKGLEAVNPDQSSAMLRMFEEAVFTSDWKGFSSKDKKLLFDTAMEKYDGIAREEVERERAIRSKNASTSIFFGDKPQDIDGDLIGVRTSHAVYGDKIILMQWTEREWENLIRGARKPIIAEDGEKWKSAQEWQRAMEQDGWKLVWMTPARKRQEARSMRDWAESKEKMGWPKELTERGREQEQFSREREKDLKREQW